MLIIQLLQINLHKICIIQDYGRLNQVNQRMRIHQELRIPDIQDQVMDGLRVVNIQANQTQLKGFHKDNIIQLFLQHHQRSTYTHCIHLVTMSPHPRTTLMTRIHGSDISVFH